MQTAEEKIQVYKTCLDLIELIYPDRDYGFCSYHIGHISCLIAQQYHKLMDNVNAVLYLEKGLYYSKEYDELQIKLKHTSLLLKDDIEDLSEVYNGTQINRVAYEINEYKKVLSEYGFEKSYTDILKKYSQFAKSI